MPGNTPKRVFVLANHVELTLDALPLGRHYWIKGLMRAGCDVQTFSYQDALIHDSPGGSKALARLFYKRRVNDLLVSQVKSYHPDVVLILGMRLKDVGAEALAALRTAAPDCAFVGWDCECYPQLDAIRRECARKMNIVLTTGGGRLLKDYRALGVECCAYMPNLCDPDIHYRYDVDDPSRTDILFTGKSSSPKHLFNRERHEILTRLAQMPNARLCGCFGHPAVRGLDYFRVVSGARIGLSINFVNDVRLYHSDRLTHYTGCGTFTLARRVPDTDLLFQDKVHVRYFDTADEFFDLADWYLAHDQERERIARAGMEHAHKEFNCRRMAQHLLDLVEKGRIDAPWAEIV